MPDLLVKLYDLNFDACPKECFDGEIKIVRAMAPDKSKVIQFIRNEFNDNWASEADRSFSKMPISCFIAVKDKKIIGFSCYDATARGYFGPIGIQPGERKKGLGTKLLHACLRDMWDNEYGYAIIGGATEIDFYQKAVSATVIPQSSPGIYKRMVGKD